MERVFLKKKYNNNYQYKKKNISKLLYNYFLESILINLFLLQSFFGVRNYLVFDFFFQWHDYFFGYKNNTIIETEKQRNLMQLKTRDYSAAFFLNLNGKNSKYSVQLKSLPTWVNKKQFEELKIVSNDFYKLNKSEYSVNSKIPVQILADFKKSSNYNYRNIGISALTSNSYFYGEKIEISSKIKKYNFSIIIPYHNKFKATLKSVSSLIKRSSSEILIELILIDNNSRNTSSFLETVKKLVKHHKHIKLKTLKLSIEFNFSTLFNYGVRHSSYDHIISCNNDIIIQTENWDKILNKLVNYEPNNIWGITLTNGKKIDSLGIYFRNQIHPVNIFEFHHKRVLKQIKSSNLDIINTDAVCGAFLCTSKKTFYETGQFDEKLKVSQNDVIFCVIANSLGYNSATILDIKANHTRGLTRPYDLIESQRKRYFKEITYSQNILLKLKYFSRKNLNRYGSMPMRGFFEV